MPACVRGCPAYQAAPLPSVVRGSCVAHVLCTGVARDSDINCHRRVQWEKVGVSASDEGMGPYLSYHCCTGVVLAHHDHRVNAFHLDVHWRCYIMPRQMGVWGCSCQGARAVCSWCKLWVYLGTHRDL